MPTYVLVHGAMVGGWCWRWVTPELRAAGHDVYTPTLTGLGERVHLASPSVDLDTHIGDVVNVLHFEDLTDVVLVGWSYGGMVVAGVADQMPERIAQLVYLDADVPRDGEMSSPASRVPARQELARLHGEGWLLPVPPVMTNVENRILSTLPEEDARWIAERYTPQPLKTWLQPIRLTGKADSIPTTYIRCLDGYDPTDEDTQRQDARIQSEPSWTYWEVQAPHAVPFTDPRGLAQLLLKFV